MKIIYEKFNKKPYKIFYNFLVPRKYRKHWHYHYSEIPIQNNVASFWDQAIERYQNGLIPAEHYTIKRPDIVGKKIFWQYWGQGLNRLPDIVKLCFASVDRFRGDYQVIRLTDENLADYLDIPQLIKQKKQYPNFKIAFYSDYIRTLLLYLYGGVWLDASILLTAPIPEYLIKQPFFMYSRDKLSPYQFLAKDNGHCYFNWNPEFKINHLNSFIIAQPQQEITKTILDLLTYFWQQHDDVEHYFFYQILMHQLKHHSNISIDFPIIDDVLPHLLQNVLEQPYDENQFQAIMKLSQVHKLTIHSYLPDVKFGKKTYYWHLKEIFQITH